MKNKITIEKLYENARYQGDVTLTTTKKGKFVFKILDDITLGYPTDDEVYKHLKDDRHYYNWDTATILKFLENYNAEGNVDTPVKKVPNNENLIKNCLRDIERIENGLNDLKKVLNEINTRDEILLNTEELLVYWHILIKYKVIDNVVGDWTSATSQIYHTIETTETCPKKEDKKGYAVRIPFPKA